MSALAFTKLLSGITKGASDRYGTIAEEDRKQKVKDNELVASSLEKSLSNPELLPEEHDKLFREVLSRRGVDNKTIEGLSQAAGHYRQILEENSRASAKPETNVAISSDGIGPSSVSLPAMPQQPVRTMGDIAEARNLKNQSNIAEANRNAQREMVRGQLQDHIQLVKENKDDPEALKFLNALPTSSTSGPQSYNLPGTYDQNEIKRLFGDDVEAGDYTVVGDRDRNPTRYFKRQAQVFQGRTATPDQIDTAKFPKDVSGRPIVPGTNATYIPIMDRNGGAVQGYIPYSELNTFRNTNSIQIVDTQDGLQAFPVSSSTATSKIPVGAPQGPSQAGQGALPALPVKPAKAGGAGVGAGTFLGYKPTTIPEATVEKINTAQDLVTQTTNLVNQLPEVEKFIGPMAGWFAGFSLNNLGGWGLPEDVTGYFTTIREMIANKAFERGGKTLPMGEQKIYTAQLPRETDTPDTLITKLKIFLPLFQKDYQNQLKGLSGPQRVQFGLDNVPTRPSPGQPEPKGTKESKQQTLDRIFGPKK